MAGVFAFLFKSCMPTSSPTATENQVELENRIRGEEEELNSNIENGTKQVNASRATITRLLSITENPSTTRDQRDRALIDLDVVMKKYEIDKRDLDRYLVFKANLETTQNTVTMGKDVERLTELQARILESSNLTQESVDAVTNRAALNRHRLTTLSSLVDDMGTAASRDVTSGDAVKAAQLGMSLEAYRDGMSHVPRPAPPSADDITSRARELLGLGFATSSSGLLGLPSVPSTPVVSRGTPSPLPVPAPAHSPYLATTEQ